MKNIILDNNSMLKFLENEDTLNDDFTLMLELIKKLSFTVDINHSDQDTLIKIYEELYMTEDYNENKKSISILLEKYSNCIYQDEYTERINELNLLINTESKEFKDILKDTFIFDIGKGLIGFDIDEVNSGIRHAKDINEMKEVLLILSLRHEEIEKFMLDVENILDTLIFDEDIIDGIAKLNDGFENRKKEIIYHLYCIDTQIPKIIAMNVKGFREIGEQMTLPCTPESGRYEELVKVINGKRVNCELHTKMKRMSAKAPDRIYFCPSLPEGVFKEDSRSIFIYKITKHV
ncbi:hypothetical protein [Romboutsia hominis]|uniref:Uncharacterized protein n=1 Tax=Romboutsia hominis TaxID=1507512 RepID=A0A2P2BQU4_9FIRM|nr:hypothetical protein [Romboutsia hominis]CEI72721.1 Hypothetical protein FRIFI_1182 [Romboutsia hominis]